MKGWTVMAAALSLMGTSAAQAAEPIEVMVLGTYHFGNPGRDLNNVRADDMTEAGRQAELQALADALAAYRPTKIMVESEAKTPDLIDARFASFTPAALAQNPNETVQIGYRLAHQMKLGKVYAIDEQPGEGEPDYFPYVPLSDYAKAHGRQETLDALMAYGAAVTKDVEQKQKTMTVAGILAEMNQAAGDEANIGSHYLMLGIGDMDRQPGADLNAMWYLRNAKIFAKLMTVAEPGDRLLLVYGAGHNYWLRHFARETPGFVSVDPVPYLKAAVRP